MPANHPAFSCQLFIPLCSLHSSSPTGGTSRKNPEIPARTAARSPLSLNTSRIQRKALFCLPSVGKWVISVSVCFIFAISGLVWACPFLQGNRWPSSHPPLTVFPSVLESPAQWHIMWLTMCLCHHGAEGNTPSPFSPGSPIPFTQFSFSTLIAPGSSQCKEAW